MAPEQIRRGPVDKRADLYAVGAVLWEALSGRPLFEAESAGAVVDAVLRGPVPAIDSVAPVSIDLARVVHRALARNPEERFASALDMAAAIEAATRSAPAREIASWVGRVAGNDLAALDARVLALESSAPSRPDHAVGLRSEIVRASEQPTSLELASALTDTRPPGAREDRARNASRRLWSLAGICGVLALGALLVARGASRTQQGGLVFETGAERARSPEALPDLGKAAAGQDAAADMAPISTLAVADIPSSTPAPPQKATTTRAPSPSADRPSSPLLLPKAEPSSDPSRDWDRP
jgi:hypothetical protein